ncbi:glycosyltransferase family 4 protein [Marixanthomonas sp. SCSIO 43207]|uniref:glycosyltransferase family 4 protein n=1 Tax=Marixanthomonas sp. SCSIO 43207 TaxID=2779360 RepID=UPI001CA896B6|nr:glycosyltransferase family 4 protein [Marixanthomonas sp. SCSIO 43207]UAB80429.1 glycosyltransferase family 4 protein [Marixanthomonas sp. SCSIO 43207]
MNILFLTLADFRSIEDKGIYQDLLRVFRNEGHAVTIVNPVERRKKIGTNLNTNHGINHLQVKTLNISKTNILEKGLATVAIEYQYLKAIKKYFLDIKFDLVLYSTPPITFFKVIKYIKDRDNAFAYLLLKDIFPQNAIDMGMMKKGGLLHKYFEKKEKELYAISDTIGCMSEANKQFIIENNTNLSTEKIEVNPNTISPIFIKYNNQEKREVKKKYNIPLDKIVFVYGGNLGIPQGIDFLIETIATLNEPSAHILVIGNGTQYNRLKNWFDDKKPSNATLFNKLPKTEYSALLAACDVGLIFLDKRFTIPNFPSRLLAYLEMKKPVLAATDVNTDIGRVIESANCGYWVEAGNLIKIQNIISKLCNDNLIEMGENGWRLLQKEYLVERSYKLISEKIDV